MPRKPHRIRRIVFRLTFLSLAGYALRALGRGPAREHAPEQPAKPVEIARIAPRLSGRVQLDRWEDGRPSPARRRAALAMTFTALFFGGAALTAGAGDQAARLLEDVESAATATEEAAPPATETPAPEPAPAEPEPAPAEPVAVPAPAEPAPAPAEPADDPAWGTGAPDPGAEVSATAEPAAAPAASGSKAARRAKGTFARASAKQSAQAAASRARTPEKRVTAADEVLAHGGAAVVWLNRALPDPTPPARRLTPGFARGLVSASRSARVDWALVLGVLRADGARGRVPAQRSEVRRLARRLHALGANRNEWRAVYRLTGSSLRADAAVALARYNRAVGIDALVRGLAAEKENLVRRTLRDGRIDIYAGGRSDMTFGRVDVRVIALVRYLAESFGQVTVTSLFSGHRLYARPGVVSAHIYGHAVDVAKLAGLPITGHQEPGGLTEEAVKSILLLPSELQARQVISLLGLGGASFPLADHHDHIHVGY
jgi:hypothetical protein